MIWKRDRCVQKRPQQKLTQISIFLSELSSFSNLDDIHVRDSHGHITNL